jgi:Xaa-Pro aminopeptidase
MEYRDIHQLGCLTLIEGLIDLGIFKGKLEDVVEKNAHTLFFPHGIGHLLGLDVHDMEDLGDLAGYGKRQRSNLFGLKYLRLDRPLQSGMVVTIEPGFYQIPSILRNTQIRNRYRHIVNWDRLAMFDDVKGIRIEDDILVTKTGSEVLSQQLPTKVKKLELLMLI